jgi:hypothetical protein
LRSVLGTVKMVSEQMLDFVCHRARARGVVGA